MATRFTRVTVIADGRQLDVSLPATRPLVEHIPQLCSLLSLPPMDPPGSWQLSTVTAGVLDSRRSLDEAGIVDADVLFLTPPEQAPPPPFVEDVVDEVRATLDNDGSEWTGEARVNGCTALAALPVVGIAGFMWWTLTPRIGVPLVLFPLALVATAVGWLIRERGGAALIAAAVPAWTLGALGLAEAVEATGAIRLFAGLAGAGAGLYGFAAAGARYRAVSAAGLTIGALSLVGLGCLIAGLDMVRAAALLVIALLFAVGIAPQIAVSRSRLVSLLRAEQEGERVRRDEVAAAVNKGQATLAGSVTGVAVIAVTAGGALLAHRTTPAAVLGGVTALIFALRSRAFTRTRQVLPMLTVPVLLAGVAAVTIPAWLVQPASTAPWVTTGLLIPLAAILIIARGVRLDDVAAARLRRIFDALETVAVISVVPLVLAVFGAFEWVRGLAD